MAEKKLPTIAIHGKEYVLVKDRILAFHEAHKMGFITTKITYKEGSVLARAVVTPDYEEPLRVFTGHSEAIRGDKSGITGQSPVEVAETSAVGRALGMLGIGILESVASADEILKVPKYDRVGENVIQVEEDPAPDVPVPSCVHGPMKRVQTKKPGPNKGRWFYACAEPKASQCNAFDWEDELSLKLQQAKEKNRNYDIEDSQLPDEEIPPPVSDDDLPF